ncbi:MAG TPA: Fic family protein [Solirubrobacteraceae bacterium]|nr:Fic family protein [Solirubrobacteraceae bacterium]
MDRIQIGDFLLIAELHCGVAAEQLARMPRVLALGKAALAAPFARLDGHEAFPATHEKAAVYCARIVAYHPLPDGNKRTAYDVMREFMDRNEVSFRHPPEGWPGTAQAVESLAAKTLGEKEFVDWVLARTGG